MKKWAFALLVLVLLAYPARMQAQEGDSMQSVIDQVISTLELGALEEAGEGTQTLLGGDLPSLLRSIAAGERTLDMDALLDGLLVRLRASGALFPAGASKKPERRWPAQRAMPALC